MPRAELVRRNALKQSAQPARYQPNLGSVLGSLFADLGSILAKLPNPE